MVSSSNLFKCITVYYLYKQMHNFRSTCVPKRSPGYGPVHIKFPFTKYFSGARVNQILSKFLNG